MENKRPSSYDWFKGKKNDEKSSPKDKLKTTWKFTKIFLICSLFFFSIFGCIQSFIIRTDNYVGSSLEIYKTEGEISPSVASITISDSTIENPFDEDTTTIYNSKYEVQSNFWVNTKEDKDLLAAIHAQVNTFQEVKLSDANKGVNKGFSVIDDTSEKENELDLSTDYDSTKIYQFKSNSESIAIQSSVAKNSQLTTNTPEDELNSITIVSQKLTDDGKLEYKDTPVIHLDGIDPKDTTNLINANYGKLLIDEFFLQNGLGDKFSDFINIKAVDMEKYITNGDEVEINEYYRAYEVVVLDILSHSGYFPVYDENGVTSFSQIIGHMPGVGYPKETDYRPIVTWGDSFSLGPFYGLFVYPLSYITSAMMGGMPLMSGWESFLSIVIIVFSVRIFSFALTFKSTLMQTKMQQLSSKKAMIDAKYVKYEGNKQMEMRKRQEISELYKKEGINPLGSLGAAFISMPLFLAIWRVIGSLPQLKSAVWLGINFSETSWRMLFQGHWQYLFIIIIAAGIQLWSQLYPRLLTKKRDNRRMNQQEKEALKKSNKTQNIMMIIFVGMAVIFSAGIQIYWIIGGVWKIIETRITHHIILNERKKLKKGKTIPVDN